MNSNPSFIAEVSSNHSASLERSLAFIDRAADIGCDGVKFKLFKIDELFAPEILATSPEHEKRPAWELPVDFIPGLAARAKERAIQFGCTPFYLDAVSIKSSSAPCTMSSGHKCAAPGVPLQNTRCT